MNPLFSDNLQDWLQETDQPKSDQLRREIGPAIERGMKHAIKNSREVVLGRGIRQRNKDRFFYSVSFKNWFSNSARRWAARKIAPLFATAFFVLASQQMQEATCSQVDNLIGLFKTVEDAKNKAESNMKNINTVDASNETQIKGMDDLLSAESADNIAHLLYTVHGEQKGSGVDALPFVDEEADRAIELGLNELHAKRKVKKVISINYN